MVRLMFIRRNNNSFDQQTTAWACGAMDNASDYGSEDSRFDSWQARNFLYSFFVYTRDIVFSK